MVSRLVGALLVILVRSASAELVPPTRCDWSVYLEPSATGFTDVTMRNEHYSDKGALFRLAAGTLFRHCDADRSTATHVRIGLSYYLASNTGTNNATTPMGPGAELEINRAITMDLRLGGRFGVEYGGPRAPILELGPRLHVKDTLWFDAAAYVVPADSPRWPAQTGVMVGVGFEGTIGRYAGYGLVGAAASIGLWALVIGLAAH